MAEPLATIGDLEAWLAESVTDPLQQTRAEAILSAASNLVRTVPGWDHDLDVARDVTVQITLRVWQNPVLLESQTEQTGPFSHTRRWGRGGLFLTDGERALLGAPGVVSGLTSVRLSTPLPGPEPWWDDNGEDEP